jgi:hypothetical protein
MAAVLSQSTLNRIGSIRDLNWLLVTSVAVRSTVARSLPPLHSEESA